MNICVFGDSISKGVVLDGVVEKYRVLKECFANLASSIIGFDLVNYSKFGCTVGKGLELVSRHGEAVASADYTVLEFGGNDCDRPWGEISRRPNDAHDPKTPLVEFCGNYRAILEAVRAEGGRPLMLNLPPIEPRRYFDWFSRELDGANILAWLGGDVQFIYRWHELYSIACEKLAAREGVPLIDIRSPFLARRDYAALLCEDGIHPNADGHALISDTIRREAAGMLAAANG